MFHIFLRACVRMTFHFLARVVSKELIQFALQAVSNPALTPPHTHTSTHPGRRSTLEHCCLIVFYCQSSGLFHPAAAGEGGRNSYEKKSQNKDVALSICQPVKVWLYSRLHVEVEIPSRLQTLDFNRESILLFSAIFNISTCHRDTQHGIFNRVAILQNCRKSLLSKVSFQALTKNIISLPPSFSPIGCLLSVTDHNSTLPTYRHLSG